MSVERLPTWRALVSLARFRPWLLVATGLVIAASYSLPLLPGLIVQRYVDVLGGRGPLEPGPWVVIAFLVPAAIARVLVTTAGGLMEMGLQVVVATLLRTNVLRHLLGQPGARALPASSGEAISRLRDDVEFVVGALTWSFDPLGQAVVIGIALWVLVRVDAELTLAVFLPLLVVLAAVNLAGRRIERQRRARQEATGQVTGLIGEIFGAVQLVKVSGAEARVAAHLRALGDRRRRSAVGDAILTQVLQSMSGNAATIGTGLILLLAAARMRSGAFSPGDFTLFVSYLGWLSVVTTMFGYFLTQYRQAGVSAERLAALLRGAPRRELVRRRPVYLRGPLPEVEFAAKTAADRLRVLEASGLTYRYPESGRGVVDVGLRLARGSFTVVTGRIGAGKTTLLRVLLGLLPRELGEISWNGAAVADPSSFLIPPRVAYTPQVPQLFSESLAENILMGLPVERVDLPASLHLAVLEGDVGALDEGLATLVGPRGVKLSGGQRQRTAAARMLVRDAELLVFDDLSSALDVETERRLWQRIFARPDLTCLVVSHRRAVLRHADRIIVMAGGRSVAEGTLAELLESSEDMRQLWSADAAAGGG